MTALPAEGHPGERITPSGLWCAGFGLYSLPLTLSFRNAEIKKTAALVEGGVAGEKNPGTAENPVLTRPLQVVEYYLTVTNVTDANLASGQITVRDVVPTGATYVEG